MSVLKLLKNHKGDKAGAVVNRPFLEARELVANGTAERVNGGKGPAAASEANPILAVVVKRAEDAEAEVKRLTAENAELKELLEVAPKPKVPPAK